MQDTRFSAPDFSPAADAGPDCGAAAPPTLPALVQRSVQLHRMQADGTAVVLAQPRILASEAPVALVFNGISHAVMMASPADLEDFALGFGLTEGLLDGPAELYGVEVAVDFVARLRGQVRFTGVDDLIVQMRADVDRAREALA